MTRLVLFVLHVTLLAACGEPPKPERVNYEVAGDGTRQFEWDSAGGTGWIRMLVESSNLGSDGAEVAEIFFPPGFSGTTHPHELEILVVLEGTLDHIVNGESNLLEAGMVGIVREPDLVVHRAVSPDGVRVLAIWPRGGEAAGFEDSGMREVAAPSRTDTRSNSMETQ